MTDKCGWHIQPCVQWRGRIVALVVDKPFQLFAGVRVEGIEPGNGGFSFIVVRIVDGDHMQFVPE